MNYNQDQDYNNNGMIPPSEINTADQGNNEMLYDDYGNPINPDASYYANDPYYQQPPNQQQSNDMMMGENFSDFSSYGPPQPGTPYGNQGYDPNGQMMNNGQQYTPSQLSYGDGMMGNYADSGASTPGMMYDPNAIAMALPNEPYPAWTADTQAPATIEQIEDVFIDLTNKFGFQRDSMRNMFDHLWFYWILVPLECLQIKLYYLYMLIISVVIPLIIKNGILLLN